MRVWFTLLFVVMVGDAAAEAPHLRALLASDGGALRESLLARVQGALGGAASLEPQDRATAIALALQGSLCPPDIDLAGARPDSRARLLLDECGPWLPPVDADRLIERSGCGEMMVSFSAVQREMVRGPGVVLAQVAGATYGSRQADCRMLMLPTLLAPLSVQAPPLHAARLETRLDVRLDGGKVSIGLVGEGLRWDKREARAVMAPSGKRIEVAPLKDGSVDAQAVRAVARSVRALLSDAPGAARVAATPETPYASVVGVIDALREAPGPDGVLVPLFPDVVLSAGEIPKEVRP